MFTILVSYLNLVYVLNLHETPRTLVVKVDRLQEIT